MILSDKEILHLLKTKDLRVSPLNRKAIQPASLDLCLGDEFMINQHSEKDVLDFRSQPKYRTIKTEEFLLPSHSFVLACTIETISLPPDLTGFVEGRSSIGRMGLFIQNAGWVDPGFKGQLTLELYNANSLPIRLGSGRRICQIVFCKMGEKALKPYSGKYLDQKSVTATKIFMDRECATPST